MSGCQREFVCKGCQGVLQSEGKEMASGSVCRTYLGVFVPDHHALPSLASLFSGVKDLLPAVGEVEAERPGASVYTHSTGDIRGDGSRLEIVYKDQSVDYLSGVSSL
jgi:hypothetical protein